MEPSRAPKLVVIGGGTGSFTVLSGLKNYFKGISAIVNMSDDGGSTGVLRDELGALPPGDVRQCLVALSESDQVMRDLFNYRFEEGSLRGHSFGNLFLTALEKTTGSFGQAVRTAGEVLKISGQVIPVTLTDTKLVLNHADGQKTVGQHTVENTRFDHVAAPALALEPKASLNPLAKSAIEQADLIVIAPGNLYASLAPTLLVDGMSQALGQSQAKLMYICNLVTKPGQTDGFMVHDYAEEIERFIGAETLDYVIYNTRKPPRKLLEKYARAGEYAVGYDQRAFKKRHYTAIGKPLLSDTVPQLSAADQLIARTFIRHHSDKVAKAILGAYLEIE